MRNRTTRPAFSALAAVLVAGLLLAAAGAAEGGSGAGAGAEGDFGAGPIGALLSLDRQDPLSGTAVAAISARSSLVPSDGNVHRVNIGGRRIAIWCKGIGSPTVVLEHGIGYGVDSESWATVQTGVAKETRRLPLRARLRGRER